MIFISAGNANFHYFFEFEVERRRVRLYGGHDKNRSMTADFGLKSYISINKYHLLMAWANKNAAKENVSS